ncbi:helix-turn-helix domain-containing protein [Vibrio crassostreae]|uniref:helix-turn-helix domain-containing protein n=1 Tax=Vibrio crassostreae TaxID=246167 RepID=UPI001B313B1B|nr:helix-turn-helix transcriptional regulator [Vibrio crassostreae]
MFKERLATFIKDNSRKILIESVGCAQGTLSKWENGKRIPSVHYVLPLCDLLGVEPEVLIKELVEAELQL